MNYKMKHIIYSILFLSLSAILIGVSYLVYIEFIRPSRNSTPQIVNSLEKQEMEQNKIFLDKAFVFKAPYTKDKQLRFPMINLNSRDVTLANQEIQEMYQTLYQEKKKMNQVGQNIISQYQYTVYKDVLSLLIYIQHRNQGKVTYSYMTYHFYLSSGNSVTYEDVYKIASIYNFNIDLKVEDALYRWIDSESELSLEEKTQVVQNTMATYQELVQNQTLQYYLDSENHLNIILPVSTEIETVYKVFTL